MAQKNGNALERRVQSSTRPFSSVEYVAVLVLLLFALAVLAWAFFVSGDTGLTFDQRRIAFWFFALEAGAAGYFFGGVFLNLAGRTASTSSFAIRAVGGAALFLIVILLVPASPSSPSSGGQVMSEATCDLDQGLVLNVPAQGARVGPKVEVRGRTAYPQWNHFIVVTGLNAGGDIIQDSAVSVSPNGEISGKATIGSSAVGRGERYSIKFVASKTALKPGPLNPDRHMVFSNSVTVVREIHGEGS